MRRLIATCAIVLLISMNINTYLEIKAIDNLTNAVSESQQEDYTQTISLDELSAEQQQVMDIVTYNEPEGEIVIVTKEVQEDGDIIFEYGDIYDESYFYTVVNVEQGVYEYYWPAMCEDCDQPLVYDSLAELNESITCHIDQEWPNATFVTVSR